MKTNKKQETNCKTPAPDVPHGGQVSISPPANVNTPYQVLTSGIDTLDLAINVHWENDSFFDYLNTLKAQAQELDEEVPGIMKAENNLGDWKFGVKPHGSNGYEWLLNGKEFSLRIGNWKTPKTRPSVMAEISAEALWRIGVKECVAGLVSLLRGSGASKEQLKPSRVDLCVDLLFPEEEWNFNLIFNRVTRARKAQIYLENEIFTGFMIGRRKLAARAYDKAYEIDCI